LLERFGIKGVDGVLLDLGVSSWQLDNPARGFSFTRPGPLDMRMNKDEGVTAADLVNNLTKEELAKIFFEYGEEKFSRRIADAIVRERSDNPLTTTARLAEIVVEAIPAQNRRKSLIHPATRVFQALRIAVNKELEEIENFLSIVLGCLNPGGHLSIISFHSLEDRTVKLAFRELTRTCRCPEDSPICQCGGQADFRAVTRKPIVPAQAEIERNPRSRSAKLRAVERTLEEQP